MGFPKILMPTDFSNCADAALGQAMLLARCPGSELHFLHVVELHAELAVPEAEGFPSMEKLYDQLTAIGVREMRRTLTDSRFDHLRVRESHRRGVSAADEIVAYAVEERIDLIVLGTHGRRGMRRLLMGSVAEEVVRAAPCPVMTVRESGDQDAAPSFERLLVPFDFSPDSEAALAMAVELGSEFGADIHLAHVVAPPIPPGAMGLTVSYPTFTQLAHDLEASLAKRAKAASGNGVHVVPHLVEGYPAWRITALAAELDSDLIVIGSHGLSGMRRFLMGSVSERVVRSAMCPVLVLRSPADPRSEEEERLEESRSAGDASLADSPMFVAHGPGSSGLPA